MVGAMVVAPVNWLAVAKDDLRLQRVTKPAVLGLLVLAAVVASPDDSLVRVLVVAALVASLAGDVALMLDERWFILGLASFLLAHVVYVVAVLIEPEWHAMRASIGVLLGIVVLVLVGRRLDRSLRDAPTEMRVGVRAYVTVILAMLLAACAVGPWVMAIGAVSFVASDSLLGWNRFVEEDRRLQLAVMPTYHLGQLLIMLALLHRLP